VLGQWERIDEHCEYGVVVVMSLVGLDFWVGFVLGSDWSWWLCVCVCVLVFS